MTKRITNNLLDELNPSLMSPVKKSIMNICVRVRNDLRHVEHTDEVVDDPEQAITLNGAVRELAKEYFEELTEVSANLLVKQRIILPRKLPHPLQIVDRKLHWPNRAHHHPSRLVATNASDWRTET